MTKPKAYSRRLKKRGYVKRGRGRSKNELNERPRIDPQLKDIFKKVGVPKNEPFKPDQFQLEALQLIKDYDVLVSAATGAGKTWIASQAIQVYLAEGFRIWYASPLKALSNSIYQEFCKEFGPFYCGILTGDRKENPEAPIIVGTTEILRNQLYDAMYEGVNLDADMVILDEAHYLSDPDRGVVWEEVLIYLPSRVRLLLLSATISNPDEVCGWLRKIRGVPSRVVLSRERPVPLETLFLFPDGLIAPLGGKKGLNPRVKKFISSPSARSRARPEKLDFGKIIGWLRKLNLLPAIFFLKSRADCNRALLSCPRVKIDRERKQAMENTVRMFVKDYPHLEGHRQMSKLLKSRVASHHGGQLPYWKVLIEKLMNEGYLEAIFSTSTVAAGVNFPARTVVLVQSDRYNGREFVDLTAIELQQMIGRAGRRGKDYVGFALIIPGRYQDPKLIHKLNQSPAEPVNSRISINFSMTLNLLLSHRPIEVRDLLELSYAAYQEEGLKEGLWSSFKRHLQFLKETDFVDERDGLTPDGYWASKLRLDQPLVIAEAIRKGAFDGLSPEFLAGVLAPFVWDKEQDIELRTDGKVRLGELETAFDNILGRIEGLRRLKEKRGFQNPPLLFWPAVGLYLWAKGIPWDDLLYFVPVEEGDMASLVMRAADHLRQVAGLTDTHPQLAGVAKEAVNLILRAPVYLS